MLFGVEPRDVRRPSRPHHQLVASDDLADLQRLSGWQPDVIDGLFRPPYLGNDRGDSELGELDQQVL